MVLSVVGPYVLSLILDGGGSCFIFSPKHSLNSIVLVIPLLSRYREFLLPLLVPLRLAL